MVLSILKWLVIAMVLSLIALWLWEGGYWKIAKLAEVIPNPLNASTTASNFQLPGQPNFFDVPDTTSAASDMEYGASDYPAPKDALYDTNNYNAPANQHSPYEGYVNLEIGTADTADTNAEYVVVRASGRASVPITVSGWMLKSAYTGEHAIIPLAASPFYQGVVNSVQAITLGSGESVILSSGVSPVGVSFRESTCTGYLGQTQQFVPALSNSCARPTDLMPRTAENATRFGPNCIDYVERLPQCSYPILPPSDLSSSCRSFLSNTFTYSGCMHAYGSAASTRMGTWRAYDSSSTELWQNTHDSIVLTDEAGRTVATLNY